MDLEYVHHLLQIIYKNKFEGASCPSRLTSTLTLMVLPITIIILLRQTLKYIINYYLFLFYKYSNDYNEL